MKKIAVPLGTPVGDLEDLLRICLDLHNGDTALRITGHFDEARQGGYINARDPRFIEFLILAIAACQLYNGKQVTSYRYLLRQLAYARNLNPAQLERQIDEQEDRYSWRQPRWIRYFKLPRFRLRLSRIRRDTVA